MTPPLAPDERTDGELITAHRNGDAHAFGELFRRHRDRIWAVTLRTLGNPSDAADVTQETFIKAMRAVDTYRGDAAVTTWLHRIAVNTCLDHLRAQTRRPTDPLVSEDFAGTQRDAYDLHDTEVVVRGALQQLPEDQRVAIVLVDLEGRSVAEAATILGVAEGTVKSRCSRARSRMATLLSSLAPAGNPAATVDVLEPKTRRTRAKSEKGGTR